MNNPGALSITRPIPPRHRVGREAWARGCPRHQPVRQRGKLIVLYFESRELHSATPFTSLRGGIGTSLA
jgi:hypothetical protein